MLTEDNAPGIEAPDESQGYSIMKSLSDSDFPNPIADPEFMSGENGQDLVDAINTINQNLLHINAGTSPRDRDSLGGQGGVTDQIGETIVRINPQGGGKPTKKDYGDIPGPYINGYYNVTNTIARNLYGNQSQRVKDRIDETISRASIPPFGPNGDPCNFGKDEQRALATLNSINQRMFNFILNVQPLFNYGFPLATPDTVNMMISYLQHKIISDFERSGNLGILIQGVDFVARTCSTTEPPDGEVEFNPALIQDPMERIKYIIGQVYKQVIYNIGVDGKDYIPDNTTGGWGTVGENLFESLNNNSGRNPDRNFNLNDSQRYGMLTTYFHNGENLGRIGQQQYRLPDYLRVNVNRRLIGFDGIADGVRDFRYKQFLGLVPIPLLIGLHYIYYDKVVAVTEKYPTMAYYANKRLEDADNSLRMLIQEESTPLTQIPSIELVGPPSIANIIAKDEALRLKRLAVKKNQLENAPPPRQVQQMNLGLVDEDEREDANERGRQEGGDDQAQEGDRQEEQDRNYPRQFGGKTYNSQNELVRDKTKYEDLMSRADTIRNYKRALETRLRAFGEAVARSEAVYKDTDHWGSEYDRYDAFIQVDGNNNTGFRGRIHEFILNVNRKSSLGLTQYGTRRADGGGSHDQLIYNNSRDLQVTNMDTITPGDIQVSKQLHPSNPPVRSEAGRGLGPFGDMLIAGWRSATGGAYDRSERDAFYTNISNALESAYGWQQRPPNDGDARGEPFEALTKARAAVRNNTVFGIICLITFTTAQLDEAALFRDLRINAWDPEERIRVTGIIQEMDDFIRRT